jgi:hypothetical protein
MDWANDQIRPPHGALERNLHSSLGLSGQRRWTEGGSANLRRP